MLNFSVVIPVYKVEAYLDQCVGSVLMQTYPHIQVLLVDDGSPDRCGAMCDAWSKKDHRVQVVHQENGGLSAARNTGIRHAQGDYILFLDSDDWWETDRVLENIAKQLEKTPVDVLSYNYRKSFDGVLQPTYFPEELPSSEGTETLEEMGQRWINGACNKAIRRILLQDNELYFRLGITSEDIDWTLRLALKAETFGFGNISVFVYRQHGMSISNSPSLKKIMTLCDNVRHCIHLLEEAEEHKAKALTAYVAYQYGTLVYNTANLPRAERKHLMAEVKKMKWLLGGSDHPKVRLIHRCEQVLGISGTMALLRMRSKVQKLKGQGV